MLKIVLDCHLSRPIFKVDIKIKKFLKIKWILIIVIVDARGHLLQLQLILGQCDLLPTLICLNFKNHLEALSNL